MFGGPVYAFFGINPSTADDEADDATVRKLLAFVCRWGGSKFLLGNVTPVRATNVQMLRGIRPAAAIYEENERQITAMIGQADILVPCWGSRTKVQPGLHARIDALLQQLLESGKPVLMFGKTKSGDPMHPLMLGYSTVLRPVFEISEQECAA